MNSELIHFLQNSVILCAYFLLVYTYFKYIPTNRHFNHVTNSRIFKNPNLRKKNFRSTFLKSRFRQIKLYSNPPSWLARSRCHMGTFWKTKDWSSHFWESQPFRFWYVEVHHQRKLKSTKQVFLLDFRPGPAQKIWSIFYGEKFLLRRFCCVKARSFWFKNWYFPSSACCS